MTDTPRRGSRPVWLVLGLVCVLAGVGLVVAGVLRSDRSPEVAEPDMAQEARADLDRRGYKPLSKPLADLLSDPAYKPVPTQTHPLLGQPAPDFTLTDTDGHPVSLANFKNGPVVLVFYYGFHCNHCVSQLFALHQDIDKFRELGATVLAVSADPSELTRKRFQKYGAFAFPVLSDTNYAVATKYGTFAPAKKPDEEGDLLHGTFVIDRAGRVRWVNRGDGPFTENQTLLREVQALEQHRFPAP